MSDSFLPTRAGHKDKIFHHMFFLFPLLKDVANVANTYFGKHSVSRSFLIMKEAKRKKQIMIIIMHHLKQWQVKTESLSDVT